MSAVLPVVHIGYARTGSTWLQQVVFPRMEGVRSAFDHGIWRDLSWKLATREDEVYFEGTLRAFVEEFEGRHAGEGHVYSQEMISGHWLDPAGTMARNAERLKRVFPEARIVLVTRRQDDIVPALYGLYTRTGGHRPLADLLDGGQLEGWKWDRSYLDYAAVAERYAGLYGREQLHVLPYELAQREPGRFLEALREICGATGYRDEAALHSRVNASFSPPAAYLLRVWNKNLVQSQFNSAPKLGARSAGVRTHQILAERVDPILRRVDWPWPSRADRRRLEELAASYAESNARLQGYCDQPLAELGYEVAA